MEEDPLALEAVETTERALKPLLDALEEAVSSSTVGGTTTTTTNNNLPTIRAIVDKVLSHPDIFFGYNQIREGLMKVVAVVEDRMLSTLDLFSYGTYDMYTNAQPNTYLSLNEKQIMKLRQLTFITSVQTACEDGISHLPYDTIQKTLSVSNQREMEQIILSCVFARAVNGLLCQKSNQFLIVDVPPCISRDISLDILPRLIQQYGLLKDRLTTSLSGLEKAHKEVTDSMHASTTYWEKLQKKKAELEKQKQEKQKQQQGHPIFRKTSGGGGGGGFGGIFGGGGGDGGGHRSGSSSWAEPPQLAGGGGGAGLNQSSAPRPMNKRSRGGLGGQVPDSLKRF